MVVNSRGMLSDHVQLPFVFHKAGNSVGGENTGSQGEVGIDYCSELSETWVSDGRVKTGPEHPEENCSCRRK